MDGGKILGEAARFVIEQKNAVSLLVQGDVFAAMSGHGAEAELCEQIFQNRGIWRRKFHELESINTHRIVELLTHRFFSRIDDRQPRIIPTGDRYCLCAGSGIN